MFPLILLLMPLLMADCRCFTRPVIIKRIVLEVPTANTSSPLDQNKFAVVIEQALAKEGQFQYDPADNDGAIVRLSFITPHEKAIDSKVILTAILTTTAPVMEYYSFADIKTSQGSIGGQDIRQALDKIFNNLYMVMRGKNADNQVFIDKLQAHVAGIKVEKAELVNAISVLGQAQDGRALESMIKILSTTTDVVIGNACIFALSRMRAAEAMPAIIEFVERKPPLIRRQGIMAARMIATQLAAEWLLVMAYGHDDPVVKQEAMEALIEVEKKLGKAP